jgi:hypothetical protein
MISKIEDSEITDEVINEITCSLKKLSEIINRKKKVNNSDINRFKLIDINRFDLVDKKFIKLKRSFYNKVKDDLIESYDKQEPKFFHDFANEIKGKKFNLFDRLKPEIRQAVFVENKIWFDAVYIYKGNFHSTVLYKINFFTSEVKNDTNDKPMKLSLKDNLYLNVTVDGVSFYHHQVVAATFLTGYQPGYYVDHIDGIHVNNNVTNLRWVSPSENSKNKH